MRNRSSRAAVLLVMAFTTLAAGCSAARIASEDPQVAALASETLKRFRDMAELDAYRDRVRALAKSRGVYWSRLPTLSPDSILLAQNKEEPCNPAVMDCEEEGLSYITLTGSRTVARQASITNNQESEVDEGDIVKQYGRFLVVLQDGRLFSIDTGSKPADLRLVDRIDLYPSPEDDIWYDELLIHQNTLVVTAFDYGEDVSELTVLSIDEGGRLAIEARYFLQSEDYYSGSNYASRLVRAQLVFYMPVDLSEPGPIGIPRMRRWTADAGYSDWMPLFDITDVYRPIQETLTPVLHVVSACSIGASEPLGCKSRGVVGPYDREVYVSADNVYLWLTSDYHRWAFGRRWPKACPEGIDPYSIDALPSAAFQMPFRIDTVRAIHTIGSPQDQFAFDERNGRLLALLKREAAVCYSSDVQPMVFASIPLDWFGTTPVSLTRTQVTKLPATLGYLLQNRYTKDYLVYAESEGYWPSDAENAGPANLVLVPLRSPERFNFLYPPHSIERLEVIGDNAVGFGYSGEWDLGLSTLDLRPARPRIASTKVLWDVRESEGRSHAFNAIVSAEGSGAFGLPTVYRSRYEADREAPSDVQFFTMDARLAVTPVGELAAVAYVDEDGYKCEVSCYDWYGSARPIFTMGRVFALTDRELIEGEIRGRMIVEVARLRTTGTPAWQR